MTIEQRRYQRRPRFRLAGDKTSTLIKRKILHATRVILRLARVLFNHLRVVIPSEARDLTIGVRSTQITQRDRPACERSFTPFRMTERHFAPRDFRNQSTNRGRPSSNFVFGL